MNKKNGKTPIQLASDVNDWDRVTVFGDSILVAISAIFIEWGRRGPDMTRPRQIKVDGEKTAICLLTGFDIQTNNGIPLGFDSRASRIQLIRTGDRGSSQHVRGRKRSLGGSGHYVT